MSLAVLALLQYNNIKQYGFFDKDFIDQFSNISGSFGNKGSNPWWEAWKTYALSYKYSLVYIFIFYLLNTVDHFRKFILKFI